MKRIDTSCVGLKLCEGEFLLSFNCDDWAIVWSDKDEMEKIYNKSKSRIIRLREEFNKGNLTLKIPFLEYTTGDMTKYSPLDFELESFLLNELKPLCKDEIIEHAKESKPFKPIIVVLEGMLHPMMDANKFLRLQFKYLKNSSLLSKKSELEIESFLSLSDLEVERIYDESLYDIGNGEQQSKLREKFIDEAKMKNPFILELLVNHIIDQKPTLIGEHDDSKYMVYFNKEYSAPLIYFPVKAKNSIPSQSAFMARIIGVLTFASNVPLINNSTLIIKVAALAIPFNYND